MSDISISSPVQNINVSPNNPGVSVNNNGVTISYGQAIDESNLVHKPDISGVYSADRRARVFGYNPDGTAGDMTAGDAIGSAMEEARLANVRAQSNETIIRSLEQGVGTGHFPRTIYAAEPGQILTPDLPVEYDKVYYFQLMCSPGDGSATFQIPGLNFEVNGIMKEDSGYSNVVVPAGATKTYACIGSVAYEVMDNRAIATKADLANNSVLLPGVRVGTTPTDAEMNQDANYFTFYNPVDGNVSLRLRIKDNPADPGFAPFAGMVWESPMYALGKM